jgi:predicted Zn-dependent peptidase
MLARAAQTLRLSGNKTLSSEEIQEGFEYWGASANPDVGLLSSSLVLQTQNQHLEQSLKWLLEQGAEPLFPEQELTVFKQVETASLLRRMQTPRYWSSRLCFEVLYGTASPDTRFANAVDIDNLKTRDLRDWFEKQLRFSGARLFASGDFGVDELAIVNGLMGKSYASTSQASLPQIEKPETGVNIKHAMEHAQQVSLYMGKALPRLSMQEMQTASFVNMFLGGFFGSRLMQDLRETQGLTYGIGSGLAQSSCGFTWYISGEICWGWRLTRRWGKSSKKPADMLPDNCGLVLMVLSHCHQSGSFCCKTTFPTPTMQRIWTESGLLLQTKYRNLLTIICARIRLHWHWQEN